MNLHDLMLKSITEEDLVGQINLHEPIIMEQGPKYLQNTQEMQSFDFQELISVYRDRFIYLTNYFKQLGNPENLHINSHFFVDFGGFFLTYNAFYSTIMMLGDEEQTKHWKDLVLNARIIGCYAQTELAHGSDVQGLETQAHFEKETQTWRMVSPQSSSSQAWAGLLGIWSTHCVLQAQTFVDGKNIGVQTFVIPIRDPATLVPYPGVNVGDQGPQLGFLHVDNGVMMFKDYRIPQNAMLMRYVKVSDEGQVTVIGGQNAIKFGYGSMLNLRVKLVQNFVYFGMLGTLQSQSILQKNGKLDELNKFRISTELANNLAFLLSSRKLRKIYQIYQSQLAAQSDRVLNTLGQLHILCAGFKAMSGWHAMHTIGPNMSRASVGYLNSSTLPMDYSGCVPVVTYQGDNNVLLQQTAQFLLLQFDNMRKGKDLSPTFEFFKTWAFQQNPEFFFKSAKDCENIQNIEKALEFFSVSQAQNTAMALGKRVAEQKGHLQNILNQEYQSELISMSKQFILTMNFQFFREIIESDNIDTKAQEILNLLLVLNGLTVINDNFHFFIANRALCKKEGKAIIEQGLQATWKQIEPHFNFIIDSVPQKIEKIMDTLDFTQNAYLDNKATQIIKNYQIAPKL